MSVQGYDPREHPFREWWHRLRVTRWRIKQAARANDRGQRWLFVLLRPSRGFSDWRWRRRHGIPRPQWRERGRGRMARAGATFTEHTRSERRP